MFQCATGSSFNTKFYKLKNATLSYMKGTQTQPLNDVLIPNQ